jgi:hypothetical protein
LRRGPGVFLPIRACFERKVLLLVGILGGFGGGEDRLEILQALILLQRSILYF